MLHVRVSLAFTILFHFLSGAYIALHSSLDAQKEHWSSLLIFLCSPSQLCPGGLHPSHPWPQIREVKLHLTRVILVSHVALSGHVILHHRANSNLSPNLPSEPGDSGPRLCPGQKPNVKEQVSPECKSHPWPPAPADTGSLITQSRPQAADLASHWPGRAILGCDWSVLTPHWSLHSSACAVASVARAHMKKVFYKVLYNSCHKKWASDIWNVTLNLFLCNKRSKWFLILSEHFKQSWNSPRLSHN